MKTIEITPQNAIKAFQSADEKGKALLTALLGEETFKAKSKERIETFEEALEQFNIDKTEFENSCKGLTTDEVAYRKIKLIAKALNQGWTPDWDNDNEYKHYPYFNMQSGVGFSGSYCGSWVAGTGVGSRLCYKSSDLAIYAGKQFESIYKDFLTL
jgi:hypothetical protein